MSVDENVFFREATLRLCSSLDIQTALTRFFEYIGPFIPVTDMSLYISDPDLNQLRIMAWLVPTCLEFLKKSYLCPSKAGMKGRPY